MSRKSKSYRFLTFLSTLLLLHLGIVQPTVQAIASTSSMASSITGRTSWITLDCPGGVKVSTFLGNLTYPRTDLLLTGRGLPIQINLTFNANSASLDTGFGFGWRFSYQISAKRYPDDSIVISW